MFTDDMTIDVALRAVLLSGAGLLWAVLLIRMVGLRSLSKMTNFDFVMTVAVGSLLASAGQATQWSGFAQIMLAMAALFALQYFISFFRKRSSRLEDAIQNTPVLLMRDGEMLPDAMKQARVSESDVIAKLREANALDLTKVYAVVLEATGDISVLHGDSSPDAILLKHVA